MLHPEAPGREGCGDKALATSQLGGVQAAGGGSVSTTMERLAAARQPSQGWNMQPGVVTR